MMSQNDEFSSKIASRKAVIGMGYVGLPLALEFARAGFKVEGFDTDKTKVDALNGGRSYISYIPAGEIGRLTKQGKLFTTADFGRLSGVDAILICVPTPLTEREGTGPSIRGEHGTGDRRTVAAWAI